MAVPQVRHLPRSTSHDTTGMLSRFESCVLHDGQCERGVTSDSCRGTRQITTFRNDPTTSPYTPAITAMNSVTTGQRRSGVCLSWMMLRCVRASRAHYQVDAQLASPAAGAAFALQVAPELLAYRTPTPPLLASSARK